MFELRRRMRVAIGSATAALALVALPVSAASGREVVDRFLEQVGGREALQRIESVHVKGSYVIPAAGAEGTIELHYARPDSLLMSVKLPFGEYRRGLIDGVGFSIDPQQGARVLDGPELEQLRTQALRGFSLLPGARRIEPADAATRVDFEGRPCFEVELTVKDGSGRYREYYDLASGLMVGRTETVHSRGTPVSLEGFASEYRRFGGVLIATVWRHRAGGQEWTATYETIRLNDIDRAVFVLSDEVQALLSGD